MSKENYTPREVRKLTEKRATSDTELIKGGAEINEEGMLIATKEQKRKAYEEMEKEIEEKTVKEHTLWIQRHPTEIGEALFLLGASSFVALPLAAMLNLDFDFIKNLSVGVEVEYALLTLRTVATMGGIVLAGEGDKMSKEWREEALKKAAKRKK